MTVPSSDLQPIQRAPKSAGSIANWPGESGIASRLFSVVPKRRDCNQRARIGCFFTTVTRTRAPYKKKAARVWPCAASHDSGHQARA